MESIHTKVTCTVKSSFSHAFCQLWRKGYTPQDFIQGIDSLDIIQKTDDLVVRQMKLKGATVKQSITKDQSTGIVKFHNINGSDFEGDVFNQVVLSPQGKQNQVELSFFSNAKNSQGVQFPNKEIFEKALLKTKEIIQATFKN